MTLRFEINTRRQLLTIVSDGHPTIAECATLLSAIVADPNYESDLGVLYDRSRDLTPPEPHTVEWLVNFVGQRRNRVRITQVAVVFPPGVTSMAATIEALDSVRRDLGIDIGGFLRTGDALAWLGIPLNGDDSS